MDDWIGYIALAISCAVAGIFLYLSGRAESQNNTAITNPVGKRPVHGGATSKQPARNWTTIVDDVRKAVSLLQRPCVALDMTETEVVPSAHSSIGGPPSLAFVGAMRARLAFLPIGLMCKTIGSTGLRITGIAPEMP